MSGNVATALSDLGVGGDGQTTWDLAKWYDPVSKLWKTYNTNNPTVGENFNMDHTMGVWIRLLNHGGDNVLTIGAKSHPGQGRRVLCQRANIATPGVPQTHGMIL